MLSLTLWVRLNQQGILLLSSLKAATLLMTRPTLYQHPSTWRVSTGVLLTPLWISPQRHRNLPSDSMRHLSAPCKMCSSSQENNCTAAQRASFKRVHSFWTGNKPINLTPVQEWRRYIIFMCCWCSYSGLFLSCELPQTTMKSSCYSATQQILLQQDLKCEYTKRYYKESMVMYRHSTSWRWTGKENGNRLINR